MNENSGLDSTQFLPARELNPITGRMERVTIISAARLAQGDMMPFKDEVMHVSGIKSFEWPPHELQRLRILSPWHVETAVELSCKREAALRKLGAGRAPSKRIEKLATPLASHDIYFGLLRGVWKNCECMVAPIYAVDWLRISLVCFKIAGLQALQRELKSIQENADKFRAAFETAREKLDEIYALE